MKRNILALMFVYYLVFIGASTIKAEVTNLSSKLDVKMSKEVVVAKLKRINSIIKINKINCDQMNTNCANKFAALVAFANLATD